MNFLDIKDMKKKIYFDFALCHHSDSKKDRGLSNGIESKYRDDKAFALLMSKKGFEAHLHLP